MSNTLYYILQINLYLILFYIVYWLFLRRETFFRWNRFYLLFGVILSFFLPMLPSPPMFQRTVMIEETPELEKIQRPQEEEKALDHLSAVNLQGNPQKEAEVSTITPQLSELETKPTPTQASFWTWQNMLFVVYFIGLFLMLLRFLISLFAIIRLIFLQGIQKQSGYFVVNLPQGMASFSFLNILFWQEVETLENSEQQNILRHELAHIRQWHSLDILLLEFLSITFWFNPFSFLYKKSARNIHEYLADKYALQKSDFEHYSETLLKQLLKTN